tara:strand:- start:1631 stop:2251 length:621 start_codon:yes stop_codon:yes gene_type:complete
MNIEIKKTIKPVNYMNAIRLLENRVNNLIQNKGKELIWFLEHKAIFTAGTSYNEKEIIDKSIKVIKTNRGGKITWHGPGQIVCYVVIDLSKRKKDIRKFITIIEKTIIETLSELNIKSFNDRKNIGIWVNHIDKTKKIAALGIRVKRWIAYHGFSINFCNNLNEFKKIIPCGINNRGVISLKKIKDVKKSDIIKILEKNLLINLNY